MNSSIINNDMINYKNLDWKLLKSINPDIVGWMHVTSTPIDYPIVKSRSDGYYYNHNVSGDESAHGCLQAVYENDFLNYRTNIIGHAMKDGSMFVSLHKYYYIPGFFEDNKIIDIVTQDKSYKVKVWAAISVTNDKLSLGYIPTDPKLFDRWKSVIKKLSTISDNSEPSCLDSQVSFITCRPCKSIPSDGVVIVFCYLEK